MNPLLALVPLLLAGCAASGPSAPTGFQAPTGALRTQEPKDEAPKTPRLLSKADTELVQAIVKKKLKDPDSAKFEGLEGWTTKTGHAFVCGWVNAKNSFGGYTGRKPFMVELTRDPPPATNLDVLPSDSDTVMLSLLRAACPNFATVI